MPAGLDQNADDGLLAQGPACFQPVKPFDQYESITVSPDHDRAFLAVFQNARGKRFDRLEIEGLAPREGHIDILDLENLIIQHGARMLPSYPFGRKRP